MVQVYVCGRCSYRSHHKVICHNCRIHLEPECENCHNAIGNCVCLYHGKPEHKIRKIKKDFRRRIVVSVKTRKKKRKIRSRRIKKIRKIKIKRKKR